MAAKYFPETDFYQLARDKQWTLDKLVECAKSVALITTPDGSYSDDNIYGMVSSYGDAGGFYGASGELICDKNSEDLPYLAIGTTQRSTTVAQKILDVLANANVFIEYMYAFSEGDTARVVIRPTDLELCLQILNENHFSFFFIKNNFINRY